MSNKKCKLKLEDIHFRAFLEEISEIISTADMDGNIIYINEAGLKMLQYKEKDISRLKIEDLHPEETLKYLEEQALPMAIEKGSWKGETKLKKANGNIVDVLQVIVSHRNDDGELEYLSTIMKDISKEKQIVENLHNSEVYRKVLFARTYAPNIIIDPDNMSIIECNEAAAAAYGFQDKEEFKSTSLADVSAVEQYGGVNALALAKEKINETLNYGESYFHWRNIRLDGSLWDSEVHLVALKLDDKTVLQAFVKDITEEFRIEKEKKFLNNINKIIVSTVDYKEMLRKILLLILDFFDADRVWLLKSYKKNCDICEIPMSVHSSYCEKPFGKSGIYKMSLDTREIVEYVLESGFSSIHTQTSQRKIPDEIINNYGVKSEILRRLPVVVSDSWIIGMHFDRYEKNWTDSEQEFFDEVTNTVSQGLNNWLLHIELQQSIDYMGKVLDLMPSIIIGIDENLRITHWNNRAVDDIGFSGEEVIGEKLHDVMPMLIVTSEEISEAIKDNKILKYNRTKRNIGNTTFYYDTVIYPVKTDKIKGAVIRIDETTEKVKLQAKVIQADKMSAINGLAAGIAHEIKNPLAGVLQTMQVMENRLKLDSSKNLEIAEKAGLSMEALRRYINLRKIDLMMDSVKVSGKRADSIINNMLNFTRTDLDRKSQNNVIAILEEAIELAANDFVMKTKYEFSNIEIVKEFNDNVPFIKCEPVKLKVVFFNLIKNGVEAMYRKSYQGYHPEFRFNVNMTEKNVVISIQDNGDGIDEKYLKKIFNPFYSTKPEVYGTGLSLPISYYIVKDYHNGEIAVDSVFGEWTKFTIKLPLE